MRVVASLIPRELEATATRSSTLEGPGFGSGDVRFGSKADICTAQGHVRFTPESGHVQRTNDVRFVPKADISAANITYSITSSARARSVGGTVRPSALAVLRLITSSYLVGACTGRSAGFSPLRMRST